MPALVSPTESATVQSGQARRAYDLLRSLVRSDVIVADEKLVEDKLMRELGLSRLALRDALRKLAAEGVLTRQRRVGTKVARPILKMPIDDIIPMNANPLFSVIRIDAATVPSTPEIREQLQIDDDLVGLVEHAFFSGHLAIGVRTAYFRREYTQPAGWASCPTLEDAVFAVYGTPLGEVHSVIEAVSCGQEIAEMLGIEQGAPVLTRQQRLLDVDGNPLEFTFSHYRADAVSFPLIQQARHIPSNTRAA